MPVREAPPSLRELRRDRGETRGEETKRNETKRDETKRDKTKRNEKLNENVGRRHRANDNGRDAAAFGRVGEAIEATRV